MSDAVDESAAGAFGEVRKDGITGVAVGAGGAHLDEFMVMQGAGGFRGHGIRQALAADPDGGLEGMRAAAQKAALVFGQFHGGHDGDCNGSGDLEVARRSKSSGRWLQEHFADPFVKKARAEGFRSRAIYKLEELDQREKLLRPGQVCLDLGAAPGAWSQYATGRVGRNGRVVATDILSMDPIPGVEFVQGDFREDAVVAALLALVPERGVDVLLSDMAPNLSGIDAIDQPRSLYLAELALDMAGRVLKPGGTALIKVFQGSGFTELLAATRQRFAKVRMLKPEASRARSPELYLLAKDFTIV
jgi:23S rRNA (uridine2552-2'-O)-methyltransferase